MATELMPAGRPAAMVRGPQSLVSGLVLMAVAAFALFLVRDLDQGTLRAMGPAMLPRWLAVGVGLCGLALVAAGFLKPGEPLESVALRGFVFVVLGIVAFSLTIRGVQDPWSKLALPSLGLIVAGPLAIFVSGLATPEASFRELAILALALTAFCMILFGDLLNLPIPLYPQWVSDLYPASWSNDGRLRFTAFLLVALALGIHAWSTPAPYRRAALFVLSGEAFRRAGGRVADGGRVLFSHRVLGWVLAGEAAGVLAGLLFPPILGGRGVAPLATLAAGWSPDLDALLTHLAWAGLGGAVAGALLGLLYGPWMLRPILVGGALGAAAGLYLFWPRLNELTFTVGFVLEGLATNPAFRSSFGGAVAALAAAGAVLGALTGLLMHRMAVAPTAPGDGPDAVDVAPHSGTVG